MIIKYSLTVFLVLSNSQVIEFHHKVDNNVPIDNNFQDYELLHNIKLSQNEKYTLQQNRLKISSHNKNYHAGKETYFLEENQYSHLTFEEFKNQMLMSSQNCSATKTSSDLPNIGLKLDEIPRFKDWRIEGNFVTPVKNQGHCGSCWTFSSTGCLESAWAVHHNELTSLSEQQLIDCAGAFDNHGCNGGLPSHAFEYVSQNNGIDTEAGYAYKAIDEGTCSYDKNFDSPVKVKGSFNITQGDEDSLFQAVLYLNPVSIAYEVVDDFRFYAGGVYQSDNCKQGPTDVNHAVLIVGFGVDSSGTNYWIVKNSWGPAWGMDGYFWIRRGVNQCGLAVCASFPIV